MKKIIKIVTVAILILTLLCSCSINKADNEVEQGNSDIGEINKIEKNINYNQYNINAQLDVNTKQLEVNQTVTYVNNENIDLNEIYFHVYANTFKTKETAPFLFDNFENAYPRGFEPGFTTIKEIKLANNENEKIDYSFQGEGETILKILLPNTLKPNNKITIVMDYIVQIPPAGERFGWGDNNFNLGNWYPIASVYDEKDGWNLDKYYPIGDPFYSDSSDYSVNIEAPKEYTIASSGNLISEKQMENTKKWTFEANSMRDFAFIANNKFEVISEVVDKTIIKSYYYTEHENRGKKALQVGINSIKEFNEKFGKYPYPSYSVVETEFPSGMEYPGLVYINKDYYSNNSNEKWFNVVIVHETAHQWWYSIVGNDQIDEAWLDEGFASYSEKIYDEKYEGKKSANATYKRNESIMKSDLGKQTVVRSLDEFKDWDDYGPIVYSKGSLVLNEIRKEVGDELFFNIIRTYYDKYKFKIATTEDFIEVCEDISGKELDELFNQWLY